MTVLLILACTFLFIWNYNTAGICITDIICEKLYQYVCTKCVPRIKLYLLIPAVDNLFLCCIVCREELICGIKLCAEVCGFFQDVNVLSQVLREGLLTPQAGN